KRRAPKWYSLERHIKNLGGALSKLQADRVVPVLQDWGGPIGMGWATRNPERVAGVVVFNTWAFVREPRMKLPWFFKLLALGKGGWQRAVPSNIFVERAMRPGRTDEDLMPYRAALPTPADRIGLARFPHPLPEPRDLQHESCAPMAPIGAALMRLRATPVLLA